MQNENKKEDENKVISMFDKSERPAKPVSKKTEEESYDFEAIMKRNDDNSGRQSKDRNKANRGVIRSHRLKH